MSIGRRARSAGWLPCPCLLPATERPLQSLTAAKGSTSRFIRRGLMDTQPWLAVTNGQALRFFFEHLRDASERDAPESEVLYNASVLAHFATTSTASLEFPGTPVSLAGVFNLFVMDRSQHADPEVMEAAGSQCLLLT